MNDSASVPTVVTLSEDDAGERIDRVLARLVADAVIVDFAEP